MQKSRSEPEERRLFESWWRLINEVTENNYFHGYVHESSGNWAYEGEVVNAAWQAWRERAHHAGSFKVMPGIDPTYKALEDAIKACEALIDDYSTLAFEMHNEGVKECIGVLKDLLKAQAAK